MSRYRDLIEAELTSYREVRPELAIPPIFTYWASKFLSPRLIEVMGTPIPEEFFANHLAGRLSIEAQSRRIASLGCGDCATEIDVALRLRRLGIEQFSFDCFDLSPFVLERAREAVGAAGLNQVIELHEMDLNEWSPQPQVYCGVMANHSLHHLVALEHVFAAVRNALTEDGVFVNADMIGRNGHMRWPEALEIIESLWRFIPQRYKYNHLLRREEDQFVNWDCSAGSFEGVRAQEILPLLVENFEFEKFVAFGNLPDVFVDRTFGPNFSVDDPDDVAFIDFLELLNMRLIDAGVIKPTQMFAVMAKRGVAVTLCDRDWTPEFSVRVPT